MTKASEKVLTEKLNQAAKKVIVGDHYRHYKNKDYQVIGLAFLEATMEIAVIYQAEYGEKLTFIRPLSDWLATVEVDGKKVARFTKVD